MYAQIYGILSIILITLFFAKEDANYLNAGYRFKDHTSRFVFRALAVAILSDTLKELLLYTGIFIFLFDYALNFFRHLPILYIGNTANWDIFWNKIPYIQLAFKTIILIITILIYIS